MNDDRELSQLIGTRHGEHIFIHRASNHHPVWLGREAHITALDPDQVALLVQYRLAFDARCCARVN